MPSPTLQQLLDALPPPLSPPDPTSPQPITISSLYPHIVHNQLLNQVKQRIITLYDNLDKSTNTS